MCQSITSEFVTNRLITYFANCHLYLLFHLSLLFDLDSRKEDGDDCNITFQKEAARMLRRKNCFSFVAETVKIFQTRCSFLKANISSIFPFCFKILCSIHGFPTHTVLVMSIFHVMTSCHRLLCAETQCTAEQCFLIF